LTYKQSVTEGEPGCDVHQATQYLYKNLGKCLLLMKLFRSGFTQKESAAKQQALPTRIASHGKYPPLGLLRFRDSPMACALAGCS
jgi:hypothetical protein